MDFSIWPAPGRLGRHRSTARFADDGGWHGIWFADHYMPNTEDGAIADGDTHECWAVLPALAATTSGSASARWCHRRPCTIRRCSPTGSRRSITSRTVARCSASAPAGRSTNTVRTASSWHPPGERVGRFDESIQIIARPARPATDDVRRSVLHDHRRGRANPSPSSRRCRSWSVPSGPRMLRITARHADEWNTWGDVDAGGDEAARSSLRVRRSAATRRRCAAPSRPSCSWRTTPPRWPSCASTAPAGRSIVGSPSELVDTMGRYARPGVRRVHPARLELRPASPATERRRPLLEMIAALADRHV